MVPGMRYLPVVSSGVVATARRPIWLPTAAHRETTVLRKFIRRRIIKAPSKYSLDAQRRRFTMTPHCRQQAYSLSTTSPVLPAGSGRSPTTSAASSNASTYIAVVDPLLVIESRMRRVTEKSTLFILEPGQHPARVSRRPPRRR